MNHAEVVDRLAILDAAHPRKLNEGPRHPRDLLRSWYFFACQPRGVPERLARASNHRNFRQLLRDARPPYTAPELDRYLEAWSQPETGSHGRGADSVAGTNAHRARPLTTPALAGRHRGLPRGPGTGVFVKLIEQAIDATAT